MPWARAKSLGGCTNTNHMIYMRGNPNDYNRWANLTSDPQWSYESLLPFFKMSEDYRGNFPDRNFSKFSNL
jgi:choline dehydrogenase